MGPSRQVSWPIAATKRVPAGAQHQETSDQRLAVTLMLTVAEKGYGKRTRSPNYLHYVTGGKGVVT